MEVLVGSPKVVKMSFRISHRLTEQSTLHLHLKIFGTYLLKALRSRGGTNPVSRLIMLSGSWLRKLRNLKFSARYEMFDTAPTNATGIDQKTINAMTRPCARMPCDMRRVGSIVRFSQKISLGKTPVNRGVSDRISEDATC